MHTLHPFALLSLSPCSPFPHVPRPPAAGPTQCPKQSPGEADKVHEMPQKLVVMLVFLTEAQLASFMILRVVWSVKKALSF